MPKLLVVLINYNHADYLGKCVESILNQSYQDLNLLFIDNNSTERDGLSFMHEKYDHDPRVTIISNTTNKGYAKAANQGIKVALSREAEYVAIANPDIIYSPEYFEKILHRLARSPKVASITGKIYMYDFKNNKPTDIIDSVGLFAYRDRRIIDDGQGMIDEGRFSEEKEVFGISGSCPTYRISALEDSKIMDEYFDEDFFMYKEDVDLSWRLNLFGWKNLYYPQAIAYHGRGTGIFQRFTKKDMLKNRKTLTHFQKRHSFRNQHWMQLKNDLWPNIFHDFFPIIFRKIMTPFYILFAEPYLFLEYFNYLKLFPRMLKKRSLIMKNKKITSKEMGHWFQSQSGYYKK
ncbi:MAG: glycosyltransferase family 2 protein [Candidatus Gracilibacteria bacterium]